MAVESEEEDVVVRMINSAAVLHSETLDLGGKRIYEIPSEILNLKHLESLHLQSNYITELPEGFFERLTNLKWLDLRNNRLITLPASVGKHRAIRSLLLEGNSLTHLPCELGMTRSLCGLSLSGNPLEFPPSHIVQKGTQEILKYLREQCENSSWANDEERPHSRQSDEESEDTDLASNVEYPDTEHVSAGQSRESLPSNLRENTRRVSTFKLPPIVRNATTVRRSNSEREIVKGQTVKQFEPMRRSTWETIMTSLSDTNMPLPWKQDKQKSETAKETNITSEEAETKDEKPANTSKKNKLKKLPRKGKKKGKEQMETFPPILLPEPGKITSCDNDEARAVDEPTLYTEKNLNEDEWTDLNSNTKDTDKSEFNCDGALINLQVGDFIAIKVREKHFIKGQPCVGKVVAEVDERNQALVHYYTGTYDGVFRPMMSRSSPYLRKVDLENVLCKFEMQSDGSLSPRTAIRLRQMVERHSS